MDRSRAPMYERGLILSDGCMYSALLRIDLISRTRLRFLLNYVCAVFTYISQMDNRRSEQGRT